MESVWINIVFSFSIAVLGLLWRELNKKVNNAVQRELCEERSSGIAHQLERQEEILLRTEQRLIGIEKKLAYLNGEVRNVFDRD
jgi:hypothetical protein